MSNAPADNSRRRFLTVATTVVGGVGAVGAAVPFIASWNPSAKARAAGAPVEVNISKIEPGQQIRVEWRGKPVWVVRRTQAMLDELAKHEDKLRDPESKQNQQPDYVNSRSRAIKDEYLVLVGICTHLGCSPTFLKNGEFAEQVEGVADGYFCPCHGSKFDMAGRVFQGVPAPTNLQVPPHYYIDDNRILVGLNQGEA